MNSMMSHLCPAATRMIRMDHAHVSCLYGKLGPQTPASQRAALIRQICSALEIHAQVEEEIFYPALRKAGIESALLEKSEPEHAEMRAAIERVRASSSNAPEQLERLAELMQKVLHHVADEESRLLPAAERQMAGQLAELGVRMTERKLALAKPKLGQMAMDMARASPGKTGLVLTLALVALGTAMVYSSRRPQRRDMPHWH